MHWFRYLAFSDCILQIKHIVIVCTEKEGETQVLERESCCTQLPCAPQTHCACALPAQHPPLCSTELNFSLLSSRVEQKSFKESYLILIWMPKYSIKGKKKINNVKMCNILHNKGWRNNEKKCSICYSEKL